MRQSTMDQWESDEQGLGFMNTLRGSWRTWLPIAAVGAGLGLLARYFWDPMKGEARRTSLKQKGLAWKEEVKNLGAKAMHRAERIKEEAQDFVGEKISATESQASSASSTRH